MPARGCTTYLVIPERLSVGLLLFGIVIGGGGIWWGPGFAFKGFICVGQRAACNCVGQGGSGRLESASRRKDSLFLFEINAPITNRCR